MSATPLKMDATIRFRAEEDLKTKLELIAPLKRKRFAEFLREELWKVVERDAALIAASKSTQKPARALRAR
jgi:hypothetical protein